MKTSLSVLQSMVLSSIRDTPKSGRQLCAELHPHYADTSDDDTSVWIALGQLRSLGLVTSADDLYGIARWRPTSAGFDAMSHA